MINEKVLRETQTLRAGCSKVKVKCAIYTPTEYSRGAHISLSEAMSP